MKKNSKTNEVFKTVKQNRFDLIYNQIIKTNCSTKSICEHTSLKNKSNAYINWKTKNIQISKFKESNFDSKTYNVYNRHCENITKKNGTENINKC